MIQQCNTCTAIIPLKEYNQEENHNYLGNDTVQEQE